VENLKGVFKGVSSKCSNCTNTSSGEKQTYFKSLAVGELDSLNGSEKTMIK
jgi:hypothetical protein